jgi:Reductase C-terminal
LSDEQLAERAGDRHRWWSRGAECAARLRMADFAGEITILSADSHRPYELPSLSKAYLSGASGYDGVLMRPLDVKLQTVGVYRPGDEVVVRGDALSGGPFTAFYVRDGQVRAADVISNPRAFAAAKALVGRRVAASAADLADLSVPLKTLLTTTVPSAQSPLVLADLKGA